MLREMSKRLISAGWLGGIRMVIGRFSDVGSRINCVNSLFDVLLVVRIPDMGLIEATRFTSSG